MFITMSRCLGHSTHTFELEMKRRVLCDQPRSFSKESNQILIVSCNMWVGKFLFEHADCCGNGPRNSADVIFCTACTL